MMLGVKLKKITEIILKSIKMIRNYFISLKRGYFTWPNKYDQKLIRIWLKIYDTDEL